MSDLPEARQVSHGIDNIVGRFTFRLVDDERAFKRRRLWLSLHSRSQGFLLVAKH
jgi:hypothetical protein